MESTQTENLPPPPGVISSIKAGFDVIAAHITAILLPLLLDVFLWLGPRLQMDRLFNSMKQDMMSIWRAGGIPATDIQQMMNGYETAIPSINLFWLLRTFPIGFTGPLYPLRNFPLGILNLIFPPDTIATPLGDPSILQVSSLNLLGWMFILTLVGWTGGGLYFRSVAWLAAATEKDEPLQASRAIMQTILLSILWSALLFMIGVPLFLVLALLAQANIFVANIAVLILSLLSMWVIVPLFFWPHGVFLKKQNFLTSIISSIQMTRFTLPTSSMFVLTIFLLSVGLNYLWSIPNEDSWMTLFGIFGHAFVTTGLLAGSFIYYRDMNNWLQIVIEQLRSNTPRQA